MNLSTLLRKEIEETETKLKSLRTAARALNGSNGTHVKRPMSEEAREKIRQAQLKRWKGIKKAVKK